MIKKNAFAQSELLIKKWFNLSKEEIDQLGDDAFYTKAAESLFLQETEIENIKLGVMKAIGEIFKN